MRVVQPNNKTIGRRASWAVMIFPYMEEQALWDEWSKEFTQSPRSPTLEGFICPSDQPDILGQPWLRYVVNAGWAYSDPHRASPPAVIGSAEIYQEYAGDGVFFDNSQNLSMHVDPTINPDPRDQDPKHYPRIISTKSYVQTNDGTSKTLMVSENLHAWYWAYDADVTTPSYEYGALPGKDNSPIEDVKHIFGFVWSNSGASIERINGDNDFNRISPVLPVPTMAVYAAAGPIDGPHDIVTSLWESYGFPSSRHSNGVNAGFCDGHILSLRDSMEPLSVRQRHVVKSQ